MKKIIERKKEWIIFDAKDKILGRLACNIVEILIGKNNPEYSFNKDSGDYVIVINVSKILLTGNKLKQKIYYKHSEYPGNMKAIPLKNMMEKHPTFILKNAIKGMLPKNKLQQVFLKKLKLYPNDAHPHIAQKPTFIKN